MQAASILVRTIRGEVKPTMALAKPEVMFNIYHHNTSVAPMQPLMKLATYIETQEGILACSIAAGYQYADVPPMGPSVVVIADSDRARAERETNEIGQAIWAVREQLKPQVANPQRSRCSQCTEGLRIYHS